MAIVQRQVSNHQTVPDHFDVTFRVRRGNEVDPIDLGETVILCINADRLAFETNGFRSIGYEVEDETAYQLRCAGLL